MNLGVRLRCSLAVPVTIVPAALPSSLNEENKIIKTGKKINWNHGKIIENPMLGGDCLQSQACPIL